MPNHYSNDNLSTTTYVAIKSDLTATAVTLMNKEAMSSMQRSTCKVLKLHKERFDKDFKLSVIFTKLLDLRNFKKPTDLKDS